MNTRTDEQNLAAGGIDSRRLILSDGKIVTASVTVKRLPKGYQVYAYVQFKVDGKTITKYVGKVTASTKFESLTLGWVKLRERQLIEVLGWRWLNER